MQEIQQLQQSQQSQLQQEIEKEMKGLQKEKSSLIEFYAQEMNRIEAEMFNIYIGILNSQLSIELDDHRELDWIHPVIQDVLEMKEGINWSTLSPLEYSLFAVIKVISLRLDGRKAYVRGISHAKKSISTVQLHYNDLEVGKKYLIKYKTGTRKTPEGVIEIGTDDIEEFVHLDISEDDFNSIAVKLAQAKSFY